jgi:hypothetical protein
MAGPVRGGGEMANTFDWVEIRATDIEKTTRFYERVFGWRIHHKEIADGSDYWIFDTGAEPRMQNIRRAGMWLRPEGTSPGVLIYIVVNDIDDVLEKVAQLGGEIVTPKTPEGPAFKAYFTDPSGNMFGLWEEEGIG